MSRVVTCAHMHETPVHILATACMLEPLVARLFRRRRNSDMLLYAGRQTQQAR